MTFYGFSIAIIVMVEILKGFEGIWSISLFEIGVYVLLIQLELLLMLFLTKKGVEK